jgi:ribulose-phosphate 3-epimerase
MAAIAPSILAADFSRLGDLVREVERAGADRIHVDVMDGHFVPNLSMGPAVVRSLRTITRLPLEVHLMVMDPIRFMKPFHEAGATTLIVHQEVLHDPLPILEPFRLEGIRVGIAINPNTPIRVLLPYVANIDLSLCMTVHPGFGGQSFIEESVDRIQRLRELIEAENPRCELEVDGGINHVTASRAAAAGANVLVAGTAIFGSPDGAAVAVRKMKELVGCGCPRT